MPHEAAMGEGVAATLPDRRAPCLLHSKASRKGPPLTLTTSMRPMSSSLPPIC
jgi:hypothetical protein